MTGEAVIEIVRQPQRAPLSRPRPLSRDGPDTCGPAYAGYLPEPFSKCRTWGSRGAPMIAPGAPSGFCETEKASGRVGCRQ